MKKSNQVLKKHFGEVWCVLHRHGGQHCRERVKKNKVLVQYLPVRNQLFKSYSSSQKAEKSAMQPSMIQQNTNTWHADI